MTVTDSSCSAANDRPLTRYFPELLGPLREALPERCVVDGEIVVAHTGGNGLDFDALLQRIHPAESRIDRLAAETPAAFVAFDVLANGDRAVLDLPMADRRVLLEVAGRAESHGAPHTRQHVDATSPTNGSAASRVPASTA